MIHTNDVQLATLSALRFKSRQLFYFYGLVCNYCYFMDSDDVVRFAHHQGTFMRLQKLSRKLIQKKFDLHLPKVVSGHFVLGYSKKQVYNYSRYEEKRETNNQLLSSLFSQHFSVD